MMNKSGLSNRQAINQNEGLLKSQDKALKSKTDEKLEAWLMTIEDCWADEIAACLQGKFPDWRE
jgi:hypothetical protein